MSEFSAPEAVEFLSSDFNDMYPSYNVDFSAIYFCSDRADETFDIYKVAVNNEPQKLVSDLSDQEAREIELVEAVSSEYNDKCPFVYGNLLVFASDRPGGEGGFDLYYSLLQNGQWSAPLNFGPSINSAYNDYRPIVINEMIEDEQAMMIFSSDRPGGQGGYDLYFVGIDYTDTE